MKKRNVRNDYEISPNTMAILPHKYGSRVFSSVLEVNDSLIVPKKPFETIEHSCGYYGSSFGGRKEGTRQLMSVTHKAPVAIDPYHFIYFFPTHSPTREQCAWISLLHVLDFSPANQDETKVTFINKQSITLPISIDTFKNQLFRTSFLMVRFMQRMDHRSKKWFFVRPNTQKEGVNEHTHQLTFRL
ncbi:competence protein ComK [Bacillus carboniphilus]|uniref:competence protein ComK n=1 Tax=Bacillus carboniphilus TaxID=86663 RepID=UPI0031DAA717